MNNVVKNYNKIKSLIEGFLSRAITIDDVIERWPNVKMEHHEGMLYHRLLHFQIDKDIHERDPEYEVLERKAIKELFDRLV